MKDFVGKIFNISWKNWTTLLWFELPYKILGFAFVYPAILQIFRLIVRISGFSLLSHENISILFTPENIIIALCALILFASYVYMEIAAFLIYCKYGWQNKRISILQIWKGALVETLRVFHYKNLPLFLLIFPFFPFAFFTVSSSIFSSFTAPEFIVDYISSNTALSALICAAVVLLNYLLFWSIFIIPTVIFQKKRFTESITPSIELVKGKKHRILCIFLFSFFLFSAAAIILWIMFAAILYISIRIFYGGAEDAVSAFQFLYLRWNAVLIIFLNLFFQLSSSAVITVIYFGCNGHTVSPDTDKKTNLFVLKRISAIVSAVAFLTIFSETEIGGALLNYNNENVQIIAHRAGAFNVPENSLTALQKAIIDGADTAEIDIQQTKDSVLIAMHDSNFKRTAGLNKNVWEIDYDTIMRLDSGSYVSPAFACEKIPTLEKMLQTARGNIQLMIELKYTGHEENLEKEAVELIKKYHMENQCSIASMSLDILKSTKELLPEIKTVYITTVLLTDNFDVEYVDAYSVETTFLSPLLSAEARLSNKEIYAWTANSKNTINKVLSCHVDGIVTDNTMLAKECLKNENKLLVLLTDFLF